MMHISDILSLKFPTAIPSMDYTLQDDGSGAYIKEWNLPEPKPTTQDLNVWAEELDLAFREKEIARKRQEEYIKQGVTIEAMMVAVWEKEVENRPQALNDLQSKREDIKAAHPKPNEEE